MEIRLETSMDLYIPIAYSFNNVMKQLFEVSEQKHVEVATCYVKPYPTREAYRFQVGF